MTLMIIVSLKSSSVFRGGGLEFLCNLWTCVAVEKYAPTIAGSNSDRYHGVFRNCYFWFYTQRICSARVESCLFRKPNMYEGCWTRENAWHCFTSLAIDCLQTEQCIKTWCYGQSPLNQWNHPRCPNYGPLTTNDPIREGNCMLFNVLPYSFFNALNLHSNLKKITRNGSHQQIPLDGSYRSVTELNLDNARLSGFRGAGYRFSPIDAGQGTWQFYLFMYSRQLQRLSIKNCAWAYDHEDATEPLSYSRSDDQDYECILRCAVAQEQFLSEENKYCKNETRKTRH